MYGVGAFIVCHYVLKKILDLIEDKKQENLSGQQSLVRWAVEHLIH